MSDKKFKNICWSCFAFFTLAVGSVFLMFSCKPTANVRDLVEIPTMSKEQYDKDHKNHLDRYDIGRHFNHKKSKNWVPTKVPTDFKVVMLDTRYRVSDYYHFRKFNSWFKKLLFETGIQAGVESNHQALDCDNFAMLYKSLMGVSAYKSGDELEIGVAVVVVKQVNEFGGIPGTGGLHMVNLVFTNQGWFIFEPQTGDFILLEDYPNQEFVQYMIL